MYHKRSEALKIINTLNKTHQNSVVADVMFG